MTTQAQSDLIADREIVISRRYDAPPELVWRALTEPEHVDQWWGPDGFTITNIEMDVRPGGVWRFTMHGPDGTDYPNRIDYHEVVPPELLAFTHGDDGGGRSFESQIRLRPSDGGTELTMRQLHPTREARDLVVREYNAIELGKQTFARLGEHLRKLQSEGPGAG